MEEKNIQVEDKKELEEKGEDLKTIEELEAKLREKEAELEKLSSKDYNFKRLRERSEGELEELRKKATEKELLMMDEIIDLRRERDDERKARFNEVKEDVLSSLSNGDEILRKQIEQEERNIVGEALTPSELELRYRKAYLLAKGETPKANPLFTGYNIKYNDPDDKPKKFSETDEGKKQIGEWFPDIAKVMYKSDK